MSFTRATSRLEERLRANGDLKLIPYVMAGYPDAAASIELGRAYARAGAAAVEVGIPFSDPLADGPAVQRAGEVALRNGMTVAGALEVAGRVADQGVPVVLMTYVNPVLAHDPRRLAAEAAEAGVAGVIIPDLPAEEAEPVTGWLGRYEPVRSSLDLGPDPALVVPRSRVSKRWPRWSAGSARDNPCRRRWF